MTTTLAETYFFGCLVKLQLSELFIEHSRVTVVSFKHVALVDNCRRKHKMYVKGQRFIIGYARNKTSAGGW